MVSEALEIASQTEVWLPGISGRSVPGMEGR
jgi:hypothetical protein